MFTDVSDGHAFADAINCIAYYGVTNGTGDGSTYSPNDAVTRAQMAVFIARAAGVAGVDLDEPMGDKFDDIGDVWAEGRDAINQLADNGMISAGGDYRPEDSVTRAEMASFLVGLLVEASSDVRVSGGMILLGASPGMEADDYFGDARAALPRANDAEVSAIYELGITKGASAASGAEEGKAPLDYNYEPHGTVTRGQMAAFITRALAHTSARPAGVSAQFDDDEVIVSVRDENFAPVPDAVVDMFQIVSADADLAFRANGTCAEVVMVGGLHVCEIDNTDDVTDNDGDIAVDVTVGDGINVWAWTGDVGDTVDGDTDLFHLDIPKAAASAEAAKRVHVGSDFSASKVHLGSTVVYTVQLQSAADTATTVGADGKKPASFLVTLSTIAIVDSDTSTDGFQRGRASGGFSSVTTQKITTDAEGKATFSVSAPAGDSSVMRDQFQVDIHIDPGDNAPDGAAAFFIDDATAGAGPDGTTGLVTVKSGVTDLDSGLTFSTEASTRATIGVVTLKTAAEHVLASSRGASNSVTVKIVDQYGDPISGASVTLGSDQTGTVTISRPERITGRDGTRTYRYERTSSAPGTEILTVTWDPDGGGDIAAITQTVTVEWATVGASTGGTAVTIAEFDTDTNTIFAGVKGDRAMYTYDSNDRFNVGTDGNESASTYAAFERALADGLELDVVITGPRSSATNTFTLTTI